MPGPDEKYKFVDIHPFHQKNRTKWISFLKKLDTVTVFKDGSISVKGDVKFPEQSLTHIPFMFREVGGSFHVKQNSLVDLEGSPRKVSGIFNISNNPLLKTLEGSPLTVGGITADICGLVSLKGCPNARYASFIGNKELKSLSGLETSNLVSCSVANCDLTSLEGSPTELDFFDCSNNTNLKTLVGGPTRCAVFMCKNTSIENLEGAPSNITEEIDISDNRKLRSLKGLPLSDDIQYNYNNTPITKKEFEAYVDLQKAKKTESEETREFYKDDFEDF